MESKLVYKNEMFDLTDEFTDIGYMAEDIEAVDAEHNKLFIKKTNENRTIQLFLSFPSFEEFKEEIIAFDELMESAEVEILTYIIFDIQTTVSYQFKKLILAFDENEEYANMYGTKIVSGSLKDKLTKALFLIGKDGAIWHIDMPNNLEQPFDQDRIRVELNKVYQSYTGVGCHG